MRKLTDLFNRRASFRKKENEKPKIVEKSRSITQYGPDFYSDSSSTETDSEDNFPSYIPIPVIDSSEEENRSVWMEGAKDQAKLYQAYRGQLKVSAYINYGLLTVHVIAGRHLRSKFKAQSDTYVKISLLPDESKATRCKTEVVHDSNNPLYDEKFSFEMLDQDAGKRLFLSVWHRDSGRSQQCEFLGCMSFGISHIRRKPINGCYYLLNGDIGRSKHLQVAEKAHLTDRGKKNIPSVNQDVLWMEPHVFTLKRGKSGFGFTINGASPVQVCKVTPGSTADLAGLKQDDCIIRIDGLNVSRSTSESIVRIIRHAQKKITLEIQRHRRLEPPPQLKGDKSFKMSTLDRSPRRQPLCSSTPEKQRLPKQISKETLIMSPWKPSSRSSRSEAGYSTQDYGWVDDTEEGIYMEPDEVLNPQVLRLPNNDYIPMKPKLPARPASWAGTAPKPPQRRDSTSSLPTSREIIYSAIPLIDEGPDDVYTLQDDQRPALPYRPPSRELKKYFHQLEEIPERSRESFSDSAADMDDTHKNQLPPGSFMSQDREEIENFDVSPWKPHNAVPCPTGVPNDYVECHRLSQYPETNLDALDLNGEIDDYGWIDSAHTETASGRSSSGYSSATLPRSMKLSGKGSGHQSRDPGDGFHDDGYHADQGAPCQSSLPRLRKKKVSFKDFG